MAIIPKTDVPELMEQLTSNGNPLVSIVLALEERRDSFMAANNLKDPESPQYQWVKGIYDDAIMVVNAFR